jgi:hypothetical protein
MRNRSKLLIAVMAATVFFAMALSSASANRLSVSSRNIRVVWSPLTFSGAGRIIRCNVTLEGSFHNATITKSVGSLIGYISRGTAGGCGAEGSATVTQSTLPWHVRYRSFTGSLPSITGVGLSLVRAGFAIEDGSITCTTGTTETNPAVGIANVRSETGAITGLRADETVGIPLRGGFGLCSLAGNGTFSGTGVVSVLGATTGVTVRLI